MKKYTTVTIVADEGKVLTNGDIYGKVIALGKGDSVDNYYEITDEEYNAIMAEREASAEV